MEKTYQLQSKSPKRSWKFSMEFPYNEDGLNEAVRTYRNHRKIFAKDAIEFRVVMVTVEPLEILG